MIQNHYRNCTGTSYRADRSETRCGNVSLLGYGYAVPKLPDLPTDAEIDYTEKLPTIGFYLKPDKHDMLTLWADTKPNPTPVLNKHSLDYSLSLRDRNNAWNFIVAGISMLLRENE